MRLHKSFNILMGSALVLAAPVVFAQGYDPSCQELQVQQYNWLREHAASLPPALKASLDRAEEFMEEGAKLNEQRQTIMDSVAAEYNAERADNEQVIARERAVQELQRQAYGSDDMADLRRFQTERDQSLNSYIMEQTAYIVAHPDGDTQNARLSQFQNSSDTAELLFFIERLKVEVTESERESLVRAALDEEAESLGIIGGDRVDVEADNAWSQAVSVVGLFKAVAADGTATPESVYAVSRGYWDSDANIVAANMVNEVLARDLVAGMRRATAGNNFGGTPEAVKVRQSIGPRTHRATTSMSARASSDLDRNSEVRRNIRTTLERSGVAVSGPRMPAIAPVEVPSPVITPEAPKPVEQTMARIQESVTAVSDVLKKMASVTFNTALIPANEDSGTP